MLMDRELITNGSFSNRALEPWTTDIEGKVHFAPYEKGSFSVLLPPSKFLEQRVEKPVPVSAFKLRAEFTARVDPKAATDNSWFFLMVTSRAGPVYALQYELFTINKSWRTIKYPFSLIWPEKNEGVYITLINANGFDNEGHPFNEPVEITNIKLFYS
jgi:hypothetical protein